MLLDGNGQEHQVTHSTVSLHSTSHKTKILLDFFWEALNPPEYLDMDEWADKYRKLPSETSSEHGDWVTERFPFLRKIMKCLSPSMPMCKFVSVIKGCQIGFPLDINTPLLTTSGWKTMGTVDVSDEVFGPDGNPSSINALGEIKFSDECYEIEFDDKTSIVADGDHRWTVESTKSRILKTLTTREISNTYIRKNGYKKYAIKNTAPLENDKKDLLIDPYVFGLWLGDGNSYSSQLTCHVDDSKEYAEILKSKGIEHEVRNNDYRYENNRNIKFNFHRHITSLGVIKNKHIPSEYLLASRLQRIELLQGLIDTDGHVTPKGYVEFYNCNKRLIDDVRVLILSLGMKPRVRIKKQLNKGHIKSRQTMFVVQFRSIDSVPVAKLKRKISNQTSPKRTTEIARRYIVNVKKVHGRLVRCIAVDNESHLFLAGKNLIATHNTEIAINWILYVADMFPCPMMYTQASDDAIIDFSKQRLKPSIDACEKVFYKLGKGKPRDLSDTLAYKAYPGGYITMGPGNSEVYTRSKPVAYAGVDEEDSYVLSSGAGGSPIKKIENRMSNFPDSKLYRCSTPKIKETSTILKAYEGGSQEQYYVPCPHCNPSGHEAGFMFVIKWDDIRWSKEVDKEGMPLSVWCECPHCGEKIQEEDKTFMLSNGDWFSAKDAEDGKRYSVPDNTENRSFQISSLYSPFGFRSWRDCVRDWFEYLRTKDVNLLQVFINETLGEAFTLEGSEIAYHALQSRCEAYGEKYKYDVPRGGLVLTAGVDVQKDRLECATVGWGVFDECWHVDYKVFPGDPTDMGDKYGMTADGQPSVWLLLDQHLKKRYRHESGVEMPVEVTMVDTGYASEQVHVFCRNRENRRIFPVKGKDGWGMGFWQRAKKRHERYGTVDYTAYVDEIKSKVYSMLSVETPGACFVHFPISDIYCDSWFKGLVCETRKTKMVAGKRKLYWDTPEHARNEPLDTLNYAFVARHTYPINIEERAKTVGGILSDKQSELLVMQKKRPKKKRKKGSHGGLKF